MKTAALLIIPLLLTSCGVFQTRKTGERTFTDGAVQVSLVASRSRARWLGGHERLTLWFNKPGESPISCPLDELNPAWLRRMGVSVSTDHRWARLHLNIDPAKAGTLKWKDVDGDGDRDPVLQPAGDGGKKGSLFDHSYLAYVNFGGHLVIYGNDRDSTPAERERGLFTLTGRLAPQSKIHGEDLHWVDLKR